MTNTPIAIRMELDLNPQRFIQQIQVYNDDLMKQVEAGVNLAVTELNQEGVVERLVADKLKSLISSTVAAEWRRYELQHEITDRVQKMIGKKVEEIATKMADEALAKIFPEH